MADFLIHAVVAGLAIATIAGPLGTFVVWQRLAYFGDTLAHSALLGVAIGLALEIDTQLAIIFCCAGLATVLTVLQRRPELATDSLLGILSHASLAIGLLTISLMENARFDLNAYLFGDLLAISTTDLIQVTALSIGLLLAVILKWRPLLAITVHPELAQVEGYAVGRLRLLLMLMIALLVAIAMKIVGVLLITALLIIPAGCARHMARSPEQMAILAALTGWLSVVGGLIVSLFWDTPAGPSVVVCAAVFFVISAVLGNRSVSQ